MKPIIAIIAGLLLSNTASAQQITHINTWGDFTVALTSQPCPDKRWAPNGYKLAFFKDENGYGAKGCWIYSRQRGTINYFWMTKDDPRMQMPPELPASAFQRVHQPLSAR